MFLRAAFRIPLAVALLASPAAQAQLFRAYVSAAGSDANPCTLALPCRLLPAALAAVSDGGEVWMLDSANYNTATVVVAKSVSILAVPGAVGSIVALNGGPAMSVTTSGLEVALRNVAIGPVAEAIPGTHGVEMTNVQSVLTIEDSEIAGLPEDGVHVGNFGTLRVANSTLRNNGGWAIYLLAETHAVVAATRMIDNYGGVSANGFGVGGTTNASVVDCLISGGGYGVSAYTNSAALARVAVSRSTIERTNTALSATTSGAGTAEVSFGGSLVAGNLWAWYQDGAGSAVLSLGDNQLARNGLTQGTKTPLGMQ
jgi:hypothetical protein